MFNSEELDNHLKTSHTIQTESAVFAEWNMNDADNIERLGNYRYRPNVSGSQYSVLPSNYDELDGGGYYTGATDSDITVQSGFDDDNTPTLFTTTQEKMKLLYSLEDCIKPHRPRSGINKLLYLGEASNQYLDIGDKVQGTQEVLDIARRPRYYMSSRHDQFKYWTSYRTEEVDGQQEEFGVSRTATNGVSFIYDSVPFVVYKNNIPTNKLVFKMQTNVGEVDLGPFRVDDEDISDPLFGFANQTTPQRWRVEVLKGNDWVQIVSFDENSVDENGDPIIKSDGYVEIGYGLKLPDAYSSAYLYAGELADESLLPETAPYGYTYLIKDSDTDIGTLKFYDAGSWIDITPEYSWKLSNQTVDVRTSAVTQTTNPDYFINDDNQVQFREFEFIRGIRIIVETMNIPECTFDLIEMSPRLFVDVTDKVSSMNITKTMSDLGNGSVPVGSINAAVGTMELFDDDFSFNVNNSFDSTTNTGSIVANYVDKRIKFNLYQIVKNINNYDYFIPIKTMYTDEIPSVSNSTGLISLSLRDFFLFLESSKAPEILMTDVSLSYAITLLLDNIGFNNYVFRRIDSVPEMIIPYLFVAPNQNTAEVLQQLAVASQTAIFFDEYNNLVVMSKEYLLPENDQRTTDSYLYGQQEGDNLPNIINLSSEEKRVYNEGRIDYTTRYIQRAISEYKQAPYTDRYKTYGYKPALLWEVSGKEQLRSQNELPQQSQGYTLSAAPLNVDLTDDVPIVQNRSVTNNIIDVGENIDNISSYQGYLYANGEIIRYDAMEYAITGAIDDENTNVQWVANNQQYQRYFSRLPFNGKMYPTGNLRIYSEPEYEIVDGLTIMKNGAVKKHGRGQFGTPIVYHNAGLNSYWSDNAHVAGCLQQTQDYLFNTSEYINYPDLSVGEAGKIDTSIDDIPLFSADNLATDSTRNGIIKNFRANKYYTENEVNYFDTTRVGTLQSSALVFNGPTVPEQIRTADFVSYVYKELPDPYKHFGTRMRIIGKIESTTQKSQTPFGALPIYEAQNLNIDNPEQNIQVRGGAGGLAFNLNKETNNGYYFEIVSLTEDNIDSYVANNNETIVSYKISNVSCTNNVVTAKSETDVEFVVGQKIVFQGLVDKNNVTNTKTPLNGEYTITAINTDGKTFQYEIPTPTITNLSITSASANGNFIKYYVPRGDTRNSYIKGGDKVNISGTSNSDFNINNATIYSFIQSNDGWYFTVQSDVSGSATGGSVSYLPLTTTSQTGGTASISQSGTNGLANVYFYKILADENGKAVPYKLWSGLANIITDDGKFTGQYRFVGEENPTVYDLAAEYVNVGDSRRFYLYINGRQVATVTDEDPLPEYNHMALFVRGTSRCMFENIYAIGANLSQNSSVPLATPISKIPGLWGDTEIDASEALRKYAISGIIQKTYLSGISGEEPPAYNMYFDEFGTIMREAAYFNIKYDRAFPALYSKIMKTFNRLKGYAISGYYGGAYGADFLIFNCQDTSINLDDTTGNFLRIQGITFTQSTTKSLTVDDYYKKISNFSDPVYRSDGTLISPQIQREEYNRIINSRTRYGLNEFTVESPYIQTDEAAEEVFGWILGKVSTPKILVGINTFATFNLQLGDILQINYKNNDGTDIISDTDKKFVVYNIEYSKSNSDETMTMYLAEV